MIINNFNVIGEKNNKTLVFDADQEIPTLRSMDNAGNSGNLVYGIITLPWGWDSLVCILEIDVRFSHACKFTSTKNSVITSTYQ